MATSAHPTETVLLHEPERRRRLVRLCAVISGDADASEDLAQETLLEAWRNAHKLRDPAGADAWLAAIARNVCLRWARRQGRQLAVVASSDEVTVADDVDLEVELERTELAELLDRALGLLPADTREVLVARYVEESPHAEIGARLGLSEDAVSMRLSRGKVSLRRLLASELAEEAAAYGLVDAGDEWRETRIWCADCGRRRMLARRDADGDSISFRCSECNSHALSAQFPLRNPTVEKVVGDLVRPAAIHARAAQWAAQYFLTAAAEGSATCTRCGRATPVRRYLRDRDGKRRDGLYVRCDACGEEISSSARGIADGVADVRAFRSEHARTRAVPERETAFDGVPSVAVRYEDMSGSTGVTVFFARDSLRMLAAATD